MSAALLSALMKAPPAFFAREALSIGRKSKLGRYHKNAGLNARERKWREKERALNRKALGIQMENDAP